MENFTIEHTNVRTIFWKNLMTDLSHLNYNTSKHKIEYLCLSMFFVDGLPNLATFTIKTFNYFIQRHLIQFIFFWSTFCDSDNGTFFLVLINMISFTLKIIFTFVNKR